MVNVDVPEPPIDAGEKLALAPPGKPLALRLTLSLNPPVPEIVILNEAVLPALILLDPGETLIEKFGPAGACTFKVTVAICNRPPLWPVIVTVKLPAGVA